MWITGRSGRLQRLFYVCRIFRFTPRASKDIMRVRMKLERDKNVPTRRNGRGIWGKVALLFSFLSLCAYALRAANIWIVVTKGASDGNVTETLKPILAIDLDRGFENNLANLSILAFNVVWILFVSTLLSSSYAKFYTTLVCFAISVFFVLTVSKDFIVTVAFYLFTCSLYLQAIKGQKTAVDKADGG